LFGYLVHQGKANGDKVTEMRAQMALDMLSPEPAEPHFDWDDLSVAPPAVIIWEAAKHREIRPEATKELYEIILNQHPFSKSVYDALLALGDLTFNRAEKTGEKADWKEALGYYNLVTERYAMRSRTALAHLRKGRILSELSRDAEAIDVLGQILRNPNWKGLDHAKAHLELGLAYRREGNLSEAHGFFERLIVAYGGYAETVSWAYYYDLLTLEALKEPEAVQQLLEEYRTRVKVLSSTEAYPLIKEQYAL
jgi:tetratricopeptide (TPR) repeat protein